MSSPADTLPARLREGADDLPRMDSSDEYWRLRSLYTEAAERIEKLEAELARFKAASKDRCPHRPDGDMAACDHCCLFSRR